MPSRPVPNQLRVVIRPPNGPPYVVGLEQLTAHVRACRVLRMGRLSKILDRAKNAEAALEMAVEQDVQKYVERVQQIDRKREDTFLAKHSALDGHVSDLTEFADDLEDWRKNDRSSGGANTGTNTGSGSDGNAYHGTGGKNV